MAHWAAKNPLTKTYGEISGINDQTMGFEQKLGFKQAATITHRGKTNDKLEGRLCSFNPFEKI